MRNELNENELENIAGGQIVYSYDGTNGKIWITAKNPKYYSFTNANVRLLSDQMHSQGYSDQEIIDYMLNKNYIW